MKLAFASNNKNKIKEIQLLLPDYFEIVSLENLGCTEDIPETANTIEGNAILKANYVSQKYNIPCFADDSGLEVEVLDGAPGVYSARYAGEPKNDSNNIDKLLLNLENQPNRKANFKTVICLNINNEQQLFEGKIFGTITNERVGDNGFGYDSIFIPDGYTKTFAEMTTEEKSKISHRGIAVHKLIHFLANGFKTNS